MSKWYFNMFSFFTHFPRDGGARGSSKLDSQSASVCSQDPPPTLDGGDIEGNTLPATTSGNNDSRVSKMNWRAISLIAGLFQQSITWGMVMAFGTILAFYSGHLLPSTPKSLLCIVGAIPAFFILSTSIIAGRFLDAGYHSRINAIGGSLITIGLICLAFTAGNGRYGQGRYWKVLLATFPVGLGQGFYFVSATHMAASWLPKNRGLAIGITSCGASIGGVVYSFLFKDFVSRWGFQTAVLALSGLAGLTAVFVFFFSRPNPDFKRRPLPHPWSQQVFKPSTFWDSRAFKYQPFLFQVAAMCFIYFGLLAVPFFLEIWADDRQLGVQDVTHSGVGVLSGHSGMRDSYLVIVFNAAQLWGRISGPVLGDRLGQRVVYSVVISLAVVFVGAFWFNTDHYWKGALFCCFAGQAYGSVIVLPTPCVSEIIAKRQDIFGTATGMAYLIAAPFVLTGPIIAAALVDRYGPDAAGCWTMACFTGGLICTVVGLRIENRIANQNHLHLHHDHHQREKEDQEQDQEQEPQQRHDENGDVVDQQRRRDGNEKNEREK